MNTTFQDKQLVCKECGKEFVWTAGEQEFYAQKGFENAPIRCPACRQAKKQQRTGFGGDRGERKQYTIICSDCGKEGTVPFEPRNPANVRCKECFDKHLGREDKGSEQPVVSEE